MTFFPTIVSIDTSVHAWFVHLRTAEVSDLFYWITLLGNWQTVALISCGVCVYAIRKKRWHMLLPIFVSLATSSATVFMMKILVARPRPEASLIDMHDFSFPSGHAAVAVSLYGFFTYQIFLHTHRSHVRCGIVVLGTTIVLLIGVSRLYLGVHYVSDVVVGYCIGFVGMLLGLSIRHHTSHRKHDTHAR